jgi:lysophospholipase L1-like esterase
MRSPRKSFFVIVPLLSVLVTVLLVELGLALFHPIPLDIGRDLDYEPDPRTGYRIAPFSQRVLKSGGILRANSRGHVDDEVATRKPPGTFRILLLGDSFAMGMGVRPSEAFPQRLERRLNEELRTPIEIVNSGVGGWNPFQYAQYYEYYGRWLQPDLVIVSFFVGNDTYDTSLTVDSLATVIQRRRVRAQRARGALIGPEVFLHEHSHLARLLLMGSRLRPGASRRDCSDLTPRYVSLQRGRISNHLVRAPELDEFALANVRQLVRIRDLAASEGRGVRVVLIPAENQINPALQDAVLGGRSRTGYDFDMPQRMLVEMLAAERLPSLDLLPDFRRDPGCLYTNNTHWNAKGHALATDRIADWLLESKVLPRGGSRSRR